ncbi:MAG: type II toxin-antitoxin system prevent-host-death family antitoxin [Hyphomicrobium aestuarii]|nr:type II toxin-antitoxin system prevent-host-death family antitoxin [Hyphomicrobium aestuarii]
MAVRVTVHDAKTNLSELLRRVEAGEDIIIARADKPVAVLSAFKADLVNEARRAGLGSLTGKFQMPADSVLIGPLCDADLAEAFGPEAIDFK